MPYSVNEAQYKHAKQIFDYLYLRDSEAVKADLIIGFGHFDLNIPRRCARLYNEGYSKKLLFTGGSGAGSAGLGEPEAIVFAGVVNNEFSQIPSDDVIAEQNSTNTGENITMSADLLKKINDEFCFEKGIKKIIAVASPYRQKRVYLTLKKLLPDISVCNMPPVSSLEKEDLIFWQQDMNFLKLILEELERIKDYPDKGFTAKESIPNNVWTAYEHLKKEVDVGGL